MSNIALNISSRVNGANLASLNLNQEALGKCLSELRDNVLPGNTPNAVEILKNLHYGPLQAVNRIFNGLADITKYLLAKQSVFQGRQRQKIQGEFLNNILEHAEITDAHISEQQRDRLFIVYDFTIDQGKKGGSLVMVFNPLKATSDTLSPKTTSFGEYGAVTICLQEDITRPYSTLCQLSNNTGFKETSQKFESFPLVLTERWYNFAKEHCTDTKWRSADNRWYQDLEPAFPYSSEEFQRLINVGDFNTYHGNGEVHR